MILVQGISALCKWSECFKININSTILGKKPYIVSVSESVGDLILKKFGPKNLMQLSLKEWKWCGFLGFSRDLYISFSNILLFNLKFLIRNHANIFYSKSWPIFRGSSKVGTEVLYCMLLLGNFSQLNSLLFLNPCNCNGVWPLGRTLKNAAESYPYFSFHVPQCLNGTIVQLPLSFCLYLTRNQSRIAEKVLAVGHWMKTAIAIPMTLAAPPRYSIYCASNINCAINLCI